MKLLTARSARRLAGRHILGRSATVLQDPRGVFGFVGPETEPVKVPRVVGFAPADAEHALVVGYLRGSLRSLRNGSGLRRVVAQAPMPGSTLARNSAVRLLVAG